MRKIIFIFCAFAIISCGKKISNEDVVGSTWKLDSLIFNDEVYKPALGRVPMLTFDTISIFGYSGCNQFFGEYTISNGKVVFDVKGNTMMLCPDSEMEQNFFNTLVDADKLTIPENKKLLLYNESGDNIASFTKMEESGIKEE